MDLEKLESLEANTRCPKCHSANTYRRLKTKDNVCRKCGEVFKGDLVKVDLSK